MPVESYKDLIVWQKSIQLVLLIYELTEKFPKSEIYGLTSQMRRCAVSVPPNIAEGRRRSTRKEFGHFVSIAFGSGSELETQLIICKQLPFGASLDYAHIDSILSEIMKMLNTLLVKLQANS